MQNEEPNMQLETLFDDDLKSVSGGVAGTSSPDPSQSTTAHGSDFNSTNSGTGG